MAAKKHRPSVIVWGSGSGTTFRAIEEARYGGLVDFDLTHVITDREGAGIIDRVAEANKRRGRDSQIGMIIINQRCFPKGPQERGQTLAEAEATCEVLRKHAGAVLLLAGCLRILGEPVLDEFGWQPEWADEPDQGKYRARIINTHPGILPATADTYGVGAARRALEMGLDQTAHTLVAVGGSTVDGGPVIAEHCVDIPSYRWESEAEFEAAANHLFTQVLQPHEKAHLAFDAADFLLKRRFTV